MLADPRRRERQSGRPTTRRDLVQHDCLRETGESVQTGSGVQGREIEQTGTETGPAPGRRHVPRPGRSIRSDSSRLDRLPRLPGSCLLLPAMERPSHGYSWLAPPARCLSAVGACRSSGPATVSPGRPSSGERSSIRLPADMHPDQRWQDQQRTQVPHRVAAQVPASAARAGPSARAGS